MKSKYFAQGIAFIAVFLLVVSLSFGIFTKQVQDSTPVEVQLIEESAGSNDTKSSELDAEDKDLAKNSI